MATNRLIGGRLALPPEPRPPQKLSQTSATIDKIQILIMGDGVFIVENEWLCSSWVNTDVCSMQLLYVNVWEISFGGFPCWVGSILCASFCLHKTTYSVLDVCHVSVSLTVNGGWTGWSVWAECSAACIPQGRIPVSGPLWAECAGYSAILH